MTETDGWTTITVSSWNSFGDFGHYWWAALLILALTLIGGYFLGWWLGIRGPKAWLPVWIFAFMVGYIGWTMHRALTGYITFLGLVGATSCIVLLMRPRFPE